MRRRPPLNSQRELRRIETLLALEDDRSIKSGIQAACELLETGAKITRTQHQRIRSAVSPHLLSNDPFVRRWMYKLIAQLGDPPYAAYLRTQLSDLDLVPENRTWAVAALAKVSLNFKSDLMAVGEDWTLAYRLSSGMFKHVGSMRKYVRDASNEDDPLAHQWLGLLHGDGRARIPMELLKELTASPHPEVREYALFGLRKRGGGSIDQTLLGPQEIVQHPPNVRRWYYRLLLNDESNLVRFGGLIEDWVEGEGDSKAREGLALGFIGLQLNQTWHQLLEDWRQVENDPYVLTALDRYFDKFKSTWSSSTNAPTDTLPLRRHAGHLPRRKVERMPDNSGFRITSSARISTFTLVVDIERFSARSDEAQLAMFEQMLGVLRERRDLSSATCLLVGDGALVIWTDAAVSTAPVEVAFQLYDAWSELAQARIRMGAHAGSAHKLVLNDGRDQFIGDAINKAVRCCSVASPGELVVSEEYYQTVMKPHSRRISSMAWKEDEAEIKHGDVIRIRRLAYIDNG